MKTSNVTFTNFKEISPTSNFIRKSHYYTSWATFGKGRIKLKESLIPNRKHVKEIKKQMQY